MTLADTRAGGFIVALTCCGCDDGTYAAPDWEAADRFREDYLNAGKPPGYGPTWMGGHWRSAIIVAGFEPGEVAAVTP